MAMFLSERLTFDQANLVVESLTEGEGDKAKKKLFMSGVFIQGGVRNLNQRVCHSGRKVGDVVPKLANDRVEQR